MTATEKETGPARAGGATCGARAAGLWRTARRNARRACPEAPVAVETFATETARRMTDGALTGCEAAIAAADRAFATGAIR